MYLRHTIRKKDGKVHCYWRLVRSVRVGRRVIQQTILPKRMRLSEQAAPTLAASARVKYLRKNVVPTFWLRP
jgi:hypothetical protein